MLTAAIDCNYKLTTITIFCVVVVVNRFGSFTQAKKSSLYILSTVWNCWAFNNVEKLLPLQSESANFILMEKTTVIVYVSSTEMRPNRVNKLVDAQFFVYYLILLRRVKQANIYLKYKSMLLSFIQSQRLFSLAVELSSLRLFVDGFLFLEIAQTQWKY